MNFLYQSIHLLLVCVYLLLPPGFLVMAIRTRQVRGDRGPVRGLLLTFTIALMLALGLSLLYASAAQGKPIISQVFLAAYFASGMMLLLRLFDEALRWALRKVVRIPPAVGLLRVAILVLVGLPYVMASVMTYRPRVGPSANPRTQLGFDYERVAFRATDGTRLVGWWMPAAAPPRGRDFESGWGQRTVLICHGLAANKSNQLIMARHLVPGGFNVLVFDFRAHGESGGQLTTFGDLERRDVLGAVRWVRERHPEESKKIYGVGASMGGAALIAAAADDSVEGQSIDAVATYAAYDNIPLLARTMARDHFATPMRELLRTLALPMASAQTGRDLAAFAPGGLAQRLWPRPVLLIHGIGDEIIDFENAQALYEHATEPKYFLWLPKGSHNDILESEAAANVVREFFLKARREPVI